MKAINGATFLATALICMVHAAWATEPIKDYGLAGRWMFDEATGERLLDVSIHGNNGAFVGLTREAGLQGPGCLRFDGKGYAEMPLVAPLQMTEALSVQFWVKPVKGTTGFAYLVGRGSDWFVRLDGERRVHFGINIQGSKEVFSNELLAADAWSHIACVYDGKTQRVYVNGTVSSKAERNGSMKNGELPVRLGTCPWQPGLDGFIGWMDDLRINSRAVSESQITTLVERLREQPAAAAAGTTIATPVKPALRLDMFQGLPTGTARSHGAVAAQEGEGVAFNGKDAWVEVPAPALNGPQKQLSAAFWVHPSTDTVQYLVSKGDMFVRLRNGVLNFGLSIGGWKEIYAVQPLPLGRWNHVLCSYDGQRMRMYIDGELAAARRQSGEVDLGTGPLVLGTTGWAGPRGDFFSGRMGDIRIYTAGVELNTAAEHDARMAGQLKTLAERLRAVAAARRRASEQIEAWLDKQLGAAPAAAGSEDVALFSWPAMSGMPVLPKTSPEQLEAMPLRAVRFVAAAGEYESAALILRPTRALTRAMISVSDLSGPTGSIPSSRIDIKWVKAWWHDGNAWTQIEKNFDEMMCPDALLNDDSLVRVDEQLRDAFLRVGPPENRREVWFTERIPESQDRKVRACAEDYPIRDASRLVPAALEGGKNKQVWLTLGVPESTPPGVYTGSLQISNGEQTLSRVPVQVRVLPFKLESARVRYDLDKPFTMSVYYWGHPWAADEAMIGGVLRSRQQLAAELRDLKAHGMTAPIMIWSTNLLYDQEPLLRRSLQQMKDAGLNNAPLVLGDSGCLMAPDTPAGKQGLQRNIGWMRQLAREYGFTDVYFYGVDERKGNELHAQRKNWMIAREAGAKIIVSGFAGQFEAMGDIQDVCVWAFRPDPREAAKWHAKGRQIWNYYNPQAGVKSPEIYRRNFGLGLWRADYDGASTYCYQDLVGEPWNDFDHVYYRRHGFTYPAADGPIGTIAWEGYREAGDDVRYVSTCRLMARQALESGSAAAKAAAREAGEFIDALNPGDPATDLDWVRVRLIDLMLRMQGD